MEQQSKLKPVATHACCSQWIPYQPVDQAFCKKKPKKKLFFHFTNNLILNKVLFFLKIQDFFHHNPVRHMSKIHLHFLKAQKS